MRELEGYIAVKSDEISSHGFFCRDFCSQSSRFSFKREWVCLPRFIEQSFSYDNDKKSLYARCVHITSSINSLLKQTYCDFYYLFSSDGLIELALSAHGLMLEYEWATKCVLYVCLVELRSCSRLLNDNNHCHNDWWLIQVWLHVKGCLTAQLLY